MTSESEMFVVHIGIRHTQMSKQIHFCFHETILISNVFCQCPTCQCWSEQAYIENVTIVSASDTDLSHTKICTKYRKQWKSYVSFQLSWRTGTLLAVLKIFAILLKYRTFEGAFFVFSWTNKVQILFSNFSCMFLNPNNFFHFEF